jgi:hypothetical protein
MNMHIQRHSITCEVEGRIYKGTSWVAGKILTVATGMAGKSKQIGSMPNETLAKHLLEELAKDGKAYENSPAAVVA